MPIHCDDNPESPADRLPDTILTPEGDEEEEFDPVAPLDPTASDEGLVIPPGNAPNPYDADKKPKGLEKFVDEIVRGEYM